MGNAICKKNISDITEKLKTKNSRCKNLEFFESGVKIIYKNMYIPNIYTIQILERNFLPNPLSIF